MLFWLVYLTAGALFFWMTWRFTRWQKARWLGAIVRFCVFVLIFTPAKLHHEPDFWVPATMAQVFDQALGHEEAAFETSVSLAVSGAVCIFVLLVWKIFLHFFNPWRKPASVGSKEKPQEE